MYSKTHRGSWNLSWLCHIHHPPAMRIKKILSVGRLFSSRPAKTPLSKQVYSYGIAYERKPPSGGEMLNHRHLGGNSHLPATDTQQEADHVGLLLLLDLFHVLEGTHLDGLEKSLVLWWIGCRCDCDGRDGIAGEIGGRNVPCRRGRSSIVVVVTSEKFEKQDLFNRSATLCVGR